MSPGLQGAACRICRWLGTSLLALCLALPAGAEGPAAGTSAELPAVDQSLLLGFLADPDSMTLVDARSVEEYETQHVSGAVNIPFDQLNEHKPALPADVQHPIVVYCRTGRRAGLLRDQLIGLGYQRVFVLPPRQLFWSDEALVFNCGLQEDGASALPPARAESNAAGASENPMAESSK